MKRKKKLDLAIYYCQKLLTKKENCGIL